MMNNTKFMLSLVAAAVSMSGFAAHADTQEDGLKFGGSVRVNYKYVEYDEANRNKGGDFAFDVLTAKISGKHGDFGMEAEYRIVSGDNFIRYGYGYYNIDEHQQVQVGISRVPFGNPDYISNSWWLSLGYYLGFEDDFDTGIKWSYARDGWNTDAAFYKAPEFSSSIAGRYAPDIYNGEANGSQYHNEESNQFNLRQTYTWSYDHGRTMLGASAQYGQIESTDTTTGVKADGDRIAAAIHLDTLYQGWNLQLQALHYEYSPELGPDTGAIAMAVSGSSYEVALKGQVYTMNVSKAFNTGYGAMKIYNDYSVMTPDSDKPDFSNSYQNVTGATLNNGPISLQLDFIMGKNMVMSTTNNHIGMTPGDNSWEHRVNFNIGYNF